MKTSSQLYKWVCSIFCFLLFFNGWGAGGANAAPMTQSTAKILRIKQHGLHDPNCGETWSEACDLQYALITQVASDNNASWELWVSEGIYLPTTDPADRMASFRLKNNVSIYGAFRGDEQTRAERRGSYSGTILSGDIDGEAGTQHSCHVVSSDASVQTALLDSFMIRDGQAEGAECLNEAGGGLYNNGGNPWLQNVVFLLNRADLGGGMYTKDSNPLLVMVSFDYNTAQLGGGIYSQDSVVMLDQVSFYYNNAESGGGMYNLRGSPGMERVRFLYNRAQTGGGIKNSSVNGGYIGLTTFLQNYAEDSGAGVYNAAGSILDLTNVTLTGNSAVGPGGAVANEGSTTVLDHVTVFENDSQSGSGIYGGHPVARR
jgi:predicted outer membrane repeat protein